MKEKSEKKESGFATAALVLGIIGIVMSFIPFIQVVSYPLGGLAVFFSVVSFLQKKSFAKAIVSIILGVIAIVAATNMLTKVDKAVNDAVDKVNSSMDNATGKNTDSLLENDVKVEIGEFQIVKGEYSDDYKLPVSVKNISNEKASFTIDIEAVDENGKRIKDDTIFANDLQAGQSQDFEQFTLISSDEAEKLKNATFKILEVSKY